MADTNGKHDDDCAPEYRRTRVLCLDATASDDLAYLCAERRRRGQTLMTGAQIVAALLAAAAAYYADGATYAPPREGATR